MVRELKLKRRYRRPAKASKLSDHLLQCFRYLDPYTSTLNFRKLLGPVALDLEAIHELELLLYL